MLAIKISLALIVIGGTAVLAGHLRLTSTHEAPPSGAVQVPSDCITVPHACGFPDATDTGVPRGTALRQVPGQVSSGPGWYYNAKAGGVVVTANGTVLSGLYIPCDLIIEASGVTVQDVQVVTGGYFGISLRHTAGVTIENSTISGQNLTSGRIDSAVDDVYGDSTGIVIRNDNISHFRTGVQISTGLIADNYIHDPGYIRGDHTNGIYVAGTTEPLTIYGNTIFNNLGQTDDISLDAANSGQDVANKIVVDNMLVGGGYSIYGGGARNEPHVEHRHREQRVRPALLPAGRQVRSRRLLQLHREGECLVGERVVGDQPARQGHRTARQRRGSRLAPHPRRVISSFRAARHPARHRGRDRRLQQRSRHRRSP